jgi:hypothetical protein
MESAGGDERQIDVLRRTLAGSEDVRTLRALAVALEEFRDYAVEDFLGVVADLRDHLHAKMSALGAASPTPRRTCASPPSDGRTLSPAIQMTVGPWSEDEHGILSRAIWNAEDMPPP